MRFDTNATIRGSPNLQTSPPLRRPLASKIAARKAQPMDASLHVPGHYPAPQLHDGSIFTSTPYPPHPTLASQHDIGLDPFQFDPQLENQPEIQHPHNRNAFHPISPFSERSRTQQPRFHEIRSHVPLPPPQQNNVFQNNQVEGGMFGLLSASRPRPRQINDVDGGQFRVLSPHPQLLAQHLSHDEQLGRLQHELDLRPVPVTDGGTTAGHFSDMKMVPDPPRLREWRQKLFDVDENITLTEDEYVREEDDYRRSPSNLISSP